MVRTQIQFPEPLYRRLKTIAEQNDWPLAEVMRKAAEHFVSGFPVHTPARSAWSFPTLECGGDFLIDPANLHPEADAILRRPVS